MMTEEQIHGKKLKDMVTNYKLWLKESGSAVIFPYNIREYITEKTSQSHGWDDTPYDWGSETIENLASSSIYPVELTSAPSHSINEDTKEITPTEKVNGVYKLKWEVFELTQQEINDSIPIWWDDVRFKRNRLLAETDYMANSDYPITEEWKTYRQALRDITNQAHPLEVTWPTKPS